MTLAQSKTPAVLKAELALKSHGTTHHFLLLEGSFDLRFWEGRLNPAYLRPIDCGGKPNLVGTALQVASGPYASRVIGLMDADFDRLLGREAPTRVLMTDQTDLESTLMLLQCQAPLQRNVDRLVVATAEVSKRQAFENHVGCSVVERVRSAVAQYGVVRYLNELRAWGVNFESLKILNRRWFNHADCSLDAQVLYQEIVNQSGGVISLAHLQMEIQGCVQQGLLSGWQLIQGHDFLTVLAHALGLIKGNGVNTINEATLHRDLILTHWHDVQRTSMVTDLQGLAPAGYRYFL